MAVATDLRAIILRYFNPIGSDPDLESGIYAKEPSHVLGQLVMAARGQKDSFTITGTEHPTRDGTGHPRLHPRLGPRPGPRRAPSSASTRCSPRSARPASSSTSARGDGRHRPRAGRGLRAGLRARRAGHRGAAASGRRRRRLRQRRPVARAARLADRAVASTRPSPPRWPGATGARKSWATSDPLRYAVSLAAAVVAASVGSGGAGLGERTTSGSRLRRRDGRLASR